jgi:hypothetical protein
MTKRRDEAPGSASTRLQYLNPSPVPPGGPLDHELTGHANTINFEAGSSVLCCAIGPDEATIAAGEESGHVAILRLEFGPRE